jgi:asparagine synthase (glutamine-hydrolysing)
VQLGREVAQRCSQPHTTITVDGTFLAQFSNLAAKAVWVSDGAMDVSGAVELFVNQRAREIAPVRLTGNYGGEILRRLIAFRPRPILDSLYIPELVRAARTAEDTYARLFRSHPLSFVAFKQVPWHHYSRLAVEQSQLTLRSPFLDNDLVALAYRAPTAATSKDFGLRLIRERNPSLGQLATDRGLGTRRVPGWTRGSRLFQQFTFKAEYAYDYGMPPWLARLDHHLRALHLERLFLGRHKFYHYRVWYRDELAGYVKEVLLDPRTLDRPFFNRKELERIAVSHTRGTGNYTTVIHQALSLELMMRTLVEAK